MFDDGDDDRDNGAHWALSYRKGPSVIYSGGFHAIVLMGHVARGSCDDEVHASAKVELHG